MKYTLVSISNLMYFPLGGFPGSCKIFSTTVTPQENSNIFYWIISLLGSEPECYIMDANQNRFLGYTQTKMDAWENN